MPPDNVSDDSLSRELGLSAAPSSLEAEQALLGAVFMDAAEALPRVFEIGLKHNDFFKEAHGEVFEAVRHLYEKGEPVDLVTVAEALRSRGSLEKVGGAAYLAKLSDSVGIAANAARYARIIIDRAVLRQMISVTAAISEECQGSPKDVDDVLDRAEGLIYSIRDNRGSSALKRVPDLLSAAFARIEAMLDRDDSLTGIPTGFEELDKLTGGFQRSDLIILAALITL